MFEPQARNLCETSHYPEHRPEQENDALVRYPLDRISTLDVEILSLHGLEETILRNTHLFELLLKKSHDGILLVTSEMTFLRVVHSAFGHAELDVVGQSVLGFIHPDDHERVKQLFSSLAGGRAATGTCQCRVQTPAGAWVWAEIEMTDLLDDPQVQAILFNYRALPGHPPQYEPAEIPGR
jgi:PAS domain S-box-containing protein